MKSLNILSMYGRQGLLRVSIEKAYGVTNVFSKQIVFYNSFFFFFLFLLSKFLWQIQTFLVPLNPRFQMSI